VHPVSVIVLTWNGRRWIGDCLSSLIALETPAAELIVVDNASTDGTVSYVRESFPGVTVLALDRNGGYASGNNAGARAASAKYLAFLNDDTEVDGRWLTALVADLESDPSVGLVTSRIVYRDRPDMFDSAGDGYLRCGGAFKHHHGQPVDTAPGSREVFGACGAGFLIRRDLFESIGGFDEDFFMVYEDVDLSYRARLRGARCRYAASAVVRHAGSASIGRVSEPQVFYGQRNLEWTWVKNSPARLLLRSAAAHVVYGMASAVGYARQGRLGVWCRAKLAAVKGLPHVLHKRRLVQQTATVDPERLWQLMDRDWIGIKRREKRFDFAHSRVVNRPTFK
jgi:GT2 family glycosyltransferase